MGRAAGKNGASARKGATPEKACPQEKLERLAKACAHEGDVEGVERIIGKMCARGEPLDLIHYHAIVHACAQAGDIARARSYLRQMAEAGLAPTTVTYNLVINACASNGDVAEAEMWVKHMKKRGLAPTEVTYGTICKALARTGNIERIEEIMAQLEREGLVLNEYFFASLISACGACDPWNLTRAERVPAEMVSRGLSPKSVRRALDRIVGSKRAHQLLTEQEQETRRDERKSAAWQSATASTCSDPPAAPGSWASVSPSASAAPSLFGSEPPATPAGLPLVQFNDPAFPAAGAVPNATWPAGALHAQFGIVPNAAWTANIPSARFGAPAFAAAGVPNAACPTGGAASGAGAGYCFVPAMRVPQAPPGYAMVMQPMMYHV